MSFKRLPYAALGVFVLLVGCSDDDEGGGAGGTGGAGGSAAAGGSAGSGGSGGSGATGGSAGSSGSSGSGGSAGSAGSSGAGGSAGGTGMSFFVSSTPPSGTGDLDGLSGADQHCKTLAQAAGSTKTQWVAYLSASDGGNGSPVHAKDRIGSGPWYNADGEVFSPTLTALHPTIDPTQDRTGYIAVKPADALFMDETGAAVPGSEHDILTGSNADGTLYADRTCEDWTSSAANRSAQVGHSDTPSNTQFSPSWNSAHESQDCTAAGLIARGGTGRIYCFATD